MVVQEIGNCWPSLFLRVRETGVVGLAHINLQDIYEPKMLNFIYRLRRSQKPHLICAYIIQNV